jgi:hypothetical protein
VTKQWQFKKPQHSLELDTVPYRRWYSLWVPGMLLVLCVVVKQMASIGVASQVEERYAANGCGVLLNIMPYTGM